MVANMSIVKINSPDVIKHGPVSDRLATFIHSAAADAVAAPSHVEAGRLSRRIVIGHDDHASEAAHLAQLARRASESILQQPLRPGSVALISMITDAEAFKVNEYPYKAASYWHQDFAIGPTGAYGLPANLTRLIIPIGVGFRYVTGDLRFYGGEQLGEHQQGAVFNKAGMLALAPVITNHDGTLLKSDKDPEGGVMYEAAAGHAFILPNETVHRAHADLPNGRIMFMLDTVDL